MTMHQLYTHAQRSRAPSTSASTSAASIQDKLAPAGKKRRNAPGKPKPKPRRAAPQQQQQPHARPRAKQQPYQRQKQQQQPQPGAAFNVFREWSAADVPPGLEPFVSAATTTSATAQQNQNQNVVPKGKAKRERDPLDDPPPPPRTPLAPLPLPCTGRPRSNSFYLPNHAGSSGIPPGAYRRPRALTSPTSPVFRTPATTGAALAQAEAAVLRENRCRLVAGLLLNRVRARPLCPARRLLCYAAPRPYVPSCLSSELRLSPV